MTPFDPAVVAALVEQSTRAQGVPVHVQDPRVLRTVATLLSHRATGV